MDLHPPTDRRILIRRVLPLTGSGKMQISVHLHADAAAALRGAPAEDDAAGEVRRAVGELGIELRPLDPDGRDALLATIFHVSASDPETAGRIVARLQDTRGVESAYLKPLDRLP